jgi:hypothetical protein
MACTGAEAESCNQERMVTRDSKLGAKQMTRVAIINDDPRFESACEKDYRRLQ